VGQFRVSKSTTVDSAIERVKLELAELQKKPDSQLAQRHAQAMLHSLLEAKKRVVDEDKLAQRHAQALLHEL
jgi:hypothetical protein